MGKGSRILFGGRGGHTSGFAGGGPQACTDEPEMVPQAVRNPRADITRVSKAQGDNRENSNHAVRSASFQELAGACND